MTLIQLKYFQMVCQLGSFTKAAKQLSVSQPAISISIKELEAELGVQLLFRDGKIAHITEAGNIFLEQCESLLRHVDGVTALMKDVATRHSQFRLGISPMLAMAILPRLYRDFTGQNPDVHLLVTEGPRNELRAQLEQQQLDAIIVNSLSMPELPFHRAHIADYEYNFCVAPDHPLANHDHLTFSQIGDTPLVCFDRTYQHIGVMGKRFAEAGYSPNVGHETNHLSTISGMIRYNGFGSFLYGTVSGQWDDLRFIPLDPPVYACIDVYWRDSMNAMHVRKLIKSAKEFFRDGTNLERKKK